MGAKYRLQKPRRRSWSYTKDVSLCGTPSEKYFLRFDNIFEGQVANTPDTVGSFSSFCRSSHQRCSVRKSILGNFTKFTGKHVCQSLFFNKVVGLRPATLLKKMLWHRCFPVNFAKFPRTPFFTEQRRWLLLPFASFINYLLWSCSASRNAVKVFFKGVLVKRIRHSSE